MTWFNLSSAKTAVNADNLPELRKGLLDKISGLLEQAKPVSVEKPETVSTSSVGEAKPVSVEKPEPSTHTSSVEVTPQKKGKFKLITSLKLEDVSPQWKHLSSLDISEIAKKAHDEMSSELAALMGETSEVASLAAALVNHITFTVQEGINDRLADQNTGKFLGLCGEWMKAEGTIQKWDLAKRSQMETAVTEIVTRFAVKIGKEIKDKLMSYVKP